MMGFSYSNDDGPRQCFNAPKNWQLGWYDDKQISVSFDGWEGNLIGLSDFENSSVAAEDTVIAKVDLNESYYVSFNRKTGINSVTAEGGNQVLVHKRELGTGYAESDILAYLNSGDSYSSPDSNFRVTVNSIDLTSNPARANVKIERFDTPPPCNTGTVSVFLNPDSYPGETSWNLKDDAENVVASSGSTGASNIVLPDGYYTFSIIDSYGDGICCAYGNGSYTLQVGSTVVKTGGEFGSQESTPFGICNNVLPTSAPTNSPTSSPTASPTTCDTVQVKIITDTYPVETSWQLTDATSAVVLSGGGYTVSDTYISEVCVDDWTSLSFTIMDSYGDGICCIYGSGSYTVTVNGNTALSGGAFLSAETKPLYTSPCDYGEEIVDGEVVCKCAPTEMRIAVDLTTDRYPQETSWTVTTCGGDELGSGSYTDSETEHTDLICVPNNVPYRFQVNDSFGDGMCCNYGIGRYQISIDGIEVVSAAGDFGSGEAHDLNGACSTNIVVSDPPIKCSSVTRKQDCLGNCEWVGKGTKGGKSRLGKCTLKPKEEPTQKCVACSSTGQECCGTCVNNGPEWMRGCYSTSKISVLTQGALSTFCRISPPERRKNYIEIKYL